MPEPDCPTAVAVDVPFIVAGDAPYSFNIRNINTQYDCPDRHKRTTSWAGMAFMPTEVKMGDIVRLEGFNNESFFWGDKYCIHAREQDVTAVECD